ncbi:MAG: hypothetical protein HFI80_09695 [Lachnospiraceae bacterium]|jgi:hypothetical protein|nr:hypothetical protein [Lachnospiraceae bacterium]MCI9661793.1 hypothetical protein [Lachnospiraceae bacterium]
MPKPILKTPQKTQADSSILCAVSTNRHQSQEQQQADKMKLDRLLRQPRSKEYMEAMHKLDAGGHLHNQGKVNEIINTIKNELPEVDLSGLLLGCVAPCYLGHPYEVHTLDFTNGIIEHYQEGQTLPDGLEKARGIAMRGGYAFIEVYVDCCRAVSANGTVSVISC